VKRTPYFCAGCPHNTSTKVPEGSKALAGIGCHFMASWMNRDTESLIQMGGEGVNWVGKSRFTGNPHVFQNLGEGTYFHSGYMAIRQAMAAGTNITYKILFNDAVAMTGGQPVDGQITVPAIAAQVRAEGVQRIAIVSDEPRKYGGKHHFPAGATLHHRDEMDALQRELREIPGVSVLIYDQACAAEKRRRRKRETYPDPAKRVFINDAVCEGCGDCSEQSNCLSIYPIDTELGRKRKIDQSSCNKDYSCVKGFCPSFVTVEGGRLRKPQQRGDNASIVARASTLPPATYSTLDENYDLLVLGIGGTGVVTVGAVITMAAHLEGKGASVLDFTGFAQKGGAVISHIRLGRVPEDMNQVRIADGRADAVIACDIVVGTDPRSTRVLAKNRTQVLVNDSEIPSGQFVQDRNADIRLNQRLQAIESVVGTERLHVLEANSLMERLLGHSVYSNVFMLGHAWQQGMVPVSEQALLRAIEINGVNITENKAAFAWGRLCAADRDTVFAEAGMLRENKVSKTLGELIAHRSGLLEAYQDENYAARYRAIVEDVERAERKLNGDTRLTETVAKYLYKLMAIKDEYEVARLYTDGEFMRKLEAQFEGDYQLSFHLAPPLLSSELDAQGRPSKRMFGPGTIRLFRLLARFKGLRGSWMDPFARLPERREERQLLSDYCAMLEDICLRLTLDNYATALKLVSLPDQVRGYGPVKSKAIKQYYQSHSELKAYFDGTVPEVVPVHNP
jgi:indolepyruvate ferredoxin oxidoreductase